ncbi:hypothetical protein IAG44_23660 [Streptomyces roseirectus]|uniref:Uncharacterized protein n=1 Tax=Streptomyces roseirectus TaxID=2768066 RepID=A0A7H0IH48_9ACTN|nr:hypothetical protein [Streptomyces roseirectus]QNP72114.1 hypothetical protein IAG44_23660 [Streptomyces roseirectus]
MSGALQDLLVNLSAASLAFVAGRSFGRVRDLWRFRDTRGFWRPFATPDLKMVTSVFIEGEQYIWERSGLVGVGDVLAIHELRQQLQRTGVSHLPLTPSHQLTGSERRGNLILVGGPHSNRVTAEIVQRLPLTYTFGPADEHDARITDSRTGEVLSPQTDAHGQLAVDLGILVRAANPFQPGRHVVVLAGSFGFGTSAAARLLADPDFLNNPLVSGGSPFEAAFSVEVVAGEPQRIDLKELRPLDTASRRPAGT